MPLGGLVHPSILGVLLSPGPVQLPQAVVLANSLHSLRINHRHLMTPHVHTPPLAIGGPVRSLLALVRLVLIRKQVNLFRPLALRLMDTGALEDHAPPPPVKVGSLNHNLTRLAGHPVPSFRLLPVAVPRRMTPSLKAITRQA